MDLSPKQIHYFKRELLAIQLRQELETVRRKPDLLARLVHPAHSETDDLPFLRYIFQHIVVEFPLLKQGGGNGSGSSSSNGQDDTAGTGNNKEFWDKAHEFLSEFGKVQLNTYAPSQADATQRQVMTRKLEKTLILALNVGIKTVQGQEESVKVTPSDLASAALQQKPEVVAAVKKRNNSNSDNNNKNSLATGPAATSSSSSSSLSAPDGEGEQVQQETKKEKQSVFTDVNVATVREIRESRTFRGTVTHAEFIISSVLVDNPSDNDAVEQQQQRIYVARRHGQFRQLHDHLQSKFPRVRVPMVPNKASRDAGDFYRDKDRLLLRSFLRRVIDHPKLSKAAAVRAFLLDNPMTLTAEELEDIERRKEMDVKRAEQEHKFRQEVDEKVVALNDLLDMLKKQVMQPGGLVQVIETIKQTERLEDLPDTLRKAFEWGRINFAFTLHTHFVTDDTAAENTATLKRTHNFMPYRTMATILRLSNPIAIVKMVLDLFLAQPLGGRSLFQRVIVANMEEDTRVIDKDIQTLEEKIGDKLLCAKVANAVNTTLPTNATGNHDRAVTNPVLETLILLQRDDIEPQLAPDQIVKLAHLDNGPNKTTKRLIKQLYDLWILRARKREQELLMSLVFQGVTGEILKELFAIFYQPLAQVYKAANIGESIQHLSAFMSDLIQLLDSLETATVETNTVEPFVRLVQRHEDKFYQFVHRVHAQDTSHLFDELVGYVDHILGSLTRGIYPKQPLDLHKVVTSAGIPPNEYQALRDEIDALCEHRRQQKLLHLERTRRKVEVHKNTTTSNNSKEIDDLMVKSARQDYQDLIQFLPSNMDIMGVINDIQDIDSEDTGSTALTDDTSSTTSSSDDSDDDEYDNERRGSNSSLQSSSEILAPPVLKIIPTVVPFFVRDVSQMMEQALRDSKNAATASQQVPDQQQQETKS
ncbi:hypothetical protein BDB00DRAFT_286644 [Zychaea mexicana]|uniref:uncharacterized protein n=1 Tax=Zychaea mexicana TaxID=64656 RepID=UPI0022FDD5B5|nr:uncharacterized protein BDB00DRAFT_286644 [Zychaea mexicana]KAI9494729.1 hypothetical protein BDB00DRAFT_286644 [Zychaea mexicana]